MKLSLYFLFVLSYFDRKIDVNNFQHYLLFGKGDIFFLTISFLSLFLSVIMNALSLEHFWPCKSFFIMPYFFKDINRFNSLFVYSIIFQPILNFVWNRLIWTLKISDLRFLSSTSFSNIKLELINVLYSHCIYFWYICTLSLVILTRLLFSL